MPVHSDISPESELIRNTYTGDVSIADVFQELEVTIGTADGMENARLIVDFRFCVLRAAPDDIRKITSETAKHRSRFPKRIAILNSGRLATALALLFCKCTDDRYEYRVFRSHRAALHWVLD